MKNRKTITLIFQAVVFLAIGAFIGLKIGQRNKNPDFQPLRAAQNQFKLISPLVGFDTSSGQAFPEFTKAKIDINNLLEQARKDKKIITAGIYLRTLADGHWFGINENENFEPGSLFKTLLMIAYFKRAETEPGVLSQKIVYSDASHQGISEGFEIGTTLQNGHSYTVEELIETMIVKSDNGAKDVLTNNISLNYLTEVFNDFGIPFPNDANYALSPKQYAIFFRRLHNSTFLNREFSEKALEIMTKVEFKNGLVAGLPSGITISHKFGERADMANGRITGAEMHDCGIIYKPNNRYILCVMTKGYDQKDLTEIIAGISKIIWENLK